MKKCLIVTISVGLITLLLGFFLGYKYYERKAPFGMRRAPRLFPGEIFGQSQVSGSPPPRQVFQRGGFLRGEILSIDDKGLTVKMDNGSSRLVLFSGQLDITKSTPASKSDLKTGEKIIVSGTPNQDGSLEARSIQILP